MIKKAVSRVLLLILAVFPTVNQAQNADSSQFQFKKTLIYTTAGAAFLTSNYLLYNTWYANYQSAPFHSFDDSKEWLQMDKIGHVTAAYYLSQLSYSALKWSGHTEKKALIGSTTGLLFLTGVEIFDGFSSEWGFSWTDMAANVLGTGLFIGQQKWLNQQVVQLKYSFHRTRYPTLRNNILGNGLAEQMLKDYNGQTYWLSFSPFSQKMKFLQFSFGYGASGMLGGFDNIWFDNDLIVDRSDIVRSRSYYFSLDIDWIRLIKKNESYFGPLRFVSFIKTPFPAIEFNSNNGFRFHPFYF